MHDTTRPTRRGRELTPRRQHREVAREAGFGTISPISVVAGLITAYGAFALVAALVGAAFSAAGVDTELRTDDWAGSGAAAAAAIALALLLAYLFGGYVAGRMARREGVVHGALVFVASLLVGGVAGGVVSALTDDEDIRSNLRSIGVPTTWNQVTDVAIAGAVLSLLAMLVGAVLGGALGERWHTKLARRVADPEIGPTAAIRARADEEATQARERAEREAAQVHARAEEEALAASHRAGQAEERRRGFVDSDPVMARDTGTERTERREPPTVADDDVDVDTDAGADTDGRTRPDDQAQRRVIDLTQEPRYTESEWRALEEQRSGR